MTPVLWFASGPVVLLICLLVLQHGIRTGRAYRAQKLRAQAASVVPVRLPSQLAPRYRPYRWTGDSVLS